jgi:hypothetical protein
MPPSDQGPRPPKPLGIGTICFVVSTLSTIAVSYAVENVKHYGYSLFLGVPFVIGLLLALLYHYDREWKWSEVLLLTLLNSAMSALWLLLCQIEGVVCILMAAVLVAGFTLMGILFVWFLRRVVIGPRRTKLN